MMNKIDKRHRRLQKTRHIIKSTGRSRLCIHRTPRHIYAQLLDDANHVVLAAASTVEKEVKDQLKGKTSNIQAAELVGGLIAERALKKKVSDVAFDRSGFKYHGRVKSLAEAARKKGLKF